MRIRRAIATTAVGTALLLGGSVGPALAASSDATTASTVGSIRVAQGQEEASVAAGGAHYWATYPDIWTCTAAGAAVLHSNPSRYYHAECTQSGRQFKLWVWF
ncbi:hypothetical protein OG301_38390 [Streptomyces platensis]|uniref:hypothetical protein n=1 Tax=Streptomyces platensis TaxID=58346 RepID=UPI002E14D9DA|nr:hypothetical protein OG229_00250 [Streptomyces platensis]WTI56732.1 hypothetical protein OG301_38390 [Streptomyces platensis]WUB77795.1 hypothetical protein OG424_00455 [Streptomyces platensis]